MVTFIIPSIGRRTIDRALYSLNTQTVSDWKCIVGFDGVEIPSGLPNSEQFKYIRLERRLGNSGNQSGYVRNYLMSLVDTDWIGFLDDDDSLRPEYVSNLQNEIKDNSLDCVVFRMSYDATDAHVLPRIGNYDIVECQVGISFAVRTDFVRAVNLTFGQSATEDFVFLDNVIKKGGNLKVSDYIGYNVRF